MKIIHKKNITLITSFIVLAFPIFAFSAIVAPCNGPDCDFNKLMDLGNNIIRFLMIDVAVPLATLGIMFTGAKLVLNQNKEHAWSEAKENFGNILMGFAIILGAYVLIKVVLYNFLNTDAGFTLFLLQ